MSGKNKRKRVAAGSSSQAVSPPEVAIPQVDLAVDARWEEFEQYKKWYLRWRHRKHWPEKQFLIDTFPVEFQPSIINIRNGRHLQKFMDEPALINRTWVREWYAKLDGFKDPPGTVVIRKKTVNTFIARINTFFGLPANIERTWEDCLTRMDQDIDRQECRYLFREGHIQDWPKKPRSRDLKPEYVFWLSFVSRYLVPTSNTNEVYPARYYMIHRLVSGQNINFGEHIMYNMMDVASSARDNLLMPYPSLISAFCRETGVIVFILDDQRPPADPIDWQKFKKKSDPLKGLFRRGPRAEVPTPVTDGPFMATHQDMLDYSFASSQWYMTEGLNKMIAAINTMPGRTAPPTPAIQFHYHGPPFGGFYAQHPESFAADSTDCIPEYHVPYIQTGRPHLTFASATISQQEQSAGLAPLSGAIQGPVGGSSSQGPVDFAAFARGSAGQGQVDGSSSRVPLGFAAFAGGSASQGSSVSRDGSVVRRDNSVVRRGKSRAVCRGKSRGGGTSRRGSAKGGIIAKVVREIDSDEDDDYEVESQDDEDDSDYE